MTQTTATLPTAEEVQRSRNIVFLGVAITLIGFIVAATLGQHLAGIALAAIGTAVIIRGGVATDEELKARIIRNMTPGTRQRRHHTLRWLLALQSSLASFAIALLGTLQQGAYYLIPISLVIVGVTAVKMIRFSDSYLEAAPAAA